MSHAIGIVVERDPAGCRVRVAFPDRDGLRSWWLPVVQAATRDDHVYHTPDLGEQVAVQMDERFEDGVVTGALYSEPEPPPVTNPDAWHVRWRDGTTVEYDRAAHRLSICAIPDARIEHQVGADSTITQTQDAIELRLGAARIVVTQDAVRIEAAAITLAGPAGSAAGVVVTGNVVASGALIDAAGNTNHHSH